MLFRLRPVACLLMLAALCSGCGGGTSPTLPTPPLAKPTPLETPAPWAKPTPAASPSPTPSPTPVSTPHFADQSLGLNQGAVPYAIYADAEGIWFTDRGQHKAIGHIASTPGSTVQEFATTGGADPLEIAWNSVRNQLVFSEAFGSSFGSFDPATATMSQTALQAIPSGYGLSQNGIAADASGTVYVAVGTDVATIGQGIYIHTSLMDDVFSEWGGFAYNSVILDHAGNLWASETQAGHLVEINPRTQDSVQDLLGPAAPTSIAEGSDNMIYAVDSASNSIMQLPEYLSFSPVRFTTSCTASYITAGRNNDLWFTEPDCDAIGRLSLATHTITEFTNAAYPGGWPDHIAVDTHGNVWFTDAKFHKVFEFGSF